MIIVTVRKIYNGMVSIRDYLVERCLKENTPLKIVYRGQCMILSPDDLRDKGFKTTGIKFNSKFYRYKRFGLIDYWWKPQNGRAEKEN
jgi:hypothetical protein